MGYSILFVDDEKIFVAVRTPCGTFATREEEKRDNHGQTSRVVGRRTDGTAARNFFGCHPQLTTINQQQQQQHSQRLFLSSFLSIRLVPPLPNRTYTLVRPSSSD